MATNGTFAQQDQHKPAADQFPSSGGDNSHLAKDEVGWYFVEQYYTTLSKSPEKLHLFYSKRSQFVYGQEAEVANVSVGRQSIQERIKALEFQDCKVRVSNVDSQASDESIVIQVIGESSNRGAEPRKFVQTFVLAQQPSGYFVLNDILRYIDEENEDAETGTAQAASTAPAADASNSAAKPDIEAAPPAQPKLISEVAEKSTANTNAAETEAKPEVVAAPSIEAAAETAAEELAKEVEKPKEPAPTPVKTETPVPEPAGPPKPMTWASRAAAAAGPRPVVPLPKTATPPVASQVRASAPVASSAPAAAPAPAVAPAPAATPAPASAAPPTTTSTKETSGWQTAGADSKRQNRPHAASATATDKEGTMGYVKYVTEKVQDAALRAALAAHGELSYFDINRQKNCAFVEFKTLEAYQAAISSNPHIVNGENIVVEPRRPKASAYNGAGVGAGRGSGASRGRGGFEAGRNGGQGNTRGNYSGQNRGRGGAPRTRGGAQAASNA